MSGAEFWVGTSWKMNKTLADARSFAEELAQADARHDPRIQRFVIPPFTAIREVAQILSPSSVKVGAQNMHWEDDGAWTGEISPVMLKDCGMDLVELGHSERRAHFGETDETVGLKVAAAHRHGLTPLICIGESLEQREAGQASEVLAQQVRGALAKAEANAPVLLAYEPVWAIGDGGMPASAGYANARHEEIAQIAEDILGRKVPCLYGGSVNASNCEELITCPHIDGVFIGRAAWKISGYLEILDLCSAAINRG